MLRFTPRIVAAFASAVLAVPAAAQFKFDPGAGGFDFPDPAGFGSSVPLDGDPVTVTAQFAPATAEQPAMVAVTAKIIPSYHISSITQPKGGPQPTSLAIDTPGVRVLGPWTPDRAPKTSIDQEIWVGLQLEEFYDEVTWRAPVEAPPGVESISGTLIGQACKDNCVPLDLAFMTEVVGPGSIPPSEITVLAESPTPEPTPDETAEPVEASPGVNPEPTPSLLAVLGGAFLGGLILNLMPCVLPVIGLKVLSFAEQAGHDRGKVLAMNLAYTAGLMSVFLLLAALAAFAGYGWGELNTHAEYRIGMVVFVFAMALSFLGVWEIPLPGFAGGKGANELQTKEGYSGAFFKGVFTTILATPCSGPFLGPVFGFLLAQPVAITFLVFGAIGLGMASPYLLIGLFPELVKALPKPGPWMETFKQLMGFVMLGTAVYFLFWVVSPVNRRPVAVMLVAVGLACWLIGRTPLTASPTRRATAWLGGWSTAALVGWVAFGLFSEPRVGAATHAMSPTELPWTAFSNDALAEATASGETVLVDFTADWCPTCQVNSKVAINTETVRQVVEANGVTPLLADWSNPNPEIKKTLNRLGSNSIPFLAIFPAGRPDNPILLPDVITESQLLAALADAGALEENPEATAIPEIEIGDAAMAGGTLR